MFSTLSRGLLYRNVRCMSTTADKERILFVCVANSCRSQLAEALGKKHLSDLYEVHSAGSTPSSPNPIAIRFLRAKGYDTSLLHSKSYADIPRPIHFAVALCDEGDMECDSYFDASILRRMCWSQKDPVKCCSEQDQLQEISRCYNNIEQRMLAFREETLQKMKLQ